MEELGPSKLVKSLLGNTFGNKYWVIIVKRRKWLRNVFIISFILAIMGLMSLGATYYYMFHYTGDLTDDMGRPIDLKKPESHLNFKRASYIYDSKGHIIGRFYDQIRDPLRLKEVPDILQKAFIAAEDQRFYSHPGIDMLAVTRAAIGNGAREFLGITWWPSSGASGLGQQFVRSIYAEEVSEFKTRERSISRKIKEARIAIQLVKRYPREKILEDFLNTIYFGHGVNGLAEASQRYFNKDIRRDKLNFREIAILVSLNKSPLLYCPIFHKPDEASFADKKEYERALAKEIVRTARARERYNWVLGRMRDENFITENDYEAYAFKKDEPLELEFLKLKPLKDRTFGYGNRLVKEYLISQGFGEDDLSYYGGLRIQTAIDTDIQKIVSEEFEKHLALLNKEQDPDNKINGAFVVMEVATGNILALSGGNNFDETQYNRVFAPRSPGSAAKLFTFAGAIEYHGKDLFSQVCNCSFSMKGGRPGERWAPKNFKEKNAVPMGQIDLARAWYRSVNLATLNLAREINMVDVLKSANAMGVWGNTGIVRDPKGNIWFQRPGYKVGAGLQPTLPTAIGASEVNLIEMANAFITFFRGGVYATPSLVKEVRDSYGESVIYKAKPPVEIRAFSKDTADKIIGMMRAVTKIGTAKISMRNIEQQVACKTGTSDGPRDVSIWCGSPELFIAIRFGHDNYEIIKAPEYMKIMSGDSDQSISGGWIAGPLARKIIDRIYANRAKKEFSADVEAQLNRILEKNKD